MVSVFFSYSHRDEDLRDELEIHLSALKRQGVIQTWHDRRIGAGKDFDREVSGNLETAEIILLLVSPYFIASDYCYDIEMQRAIERHKAGEARVIPVILHPCDWHQTPFGKLRATPPDGKPVSKFPNQHDAFLAIARDIRAAAEEIAITQSTNGRREEPELQSYTSKQRESTGRQRSSNLRIRREFTDFERSRFLSETLEYLSNFFENSLIELKVRTASIATEFRRIDANTFTAAVYRSGSLASQCKVWLAVDPYSSGEIHYSSSRSLTDNSWNESLSVDDDGYVLGLRPLGISMHGFNRESLLTKEGTSEFLWSILISPLQ